MKRIVCPGGGHAGLYAAILFQKAFDAASVADRPITAGREYTPSYLYGELGFLLAGFPSVGSDRGIAQGAQGGLQRRHQERRGKPLARHVPQTDADAPLLGSRSTSQLRTFASRGGVARMWSMRQPQSCSKAFRK